MPSFSEQRGRAFAEPSAGAIAPTGGAPSDMMEYGGGDHLAGMEPTEATGPNVADLVWMLWRTKWVVLGVFVLVSAATIPWIWLTMAPSYRATALVRVSPIMWYPLARDDGVLPFYRSFLNTQVSIIQSLKVLQRVLDREDVRGTNWYSGGNPDLAEGPASPSPEGLAAALDVSPIKSTELIEVSMLSRRPRDAKLIANAVVREYSKYSDEASDETERQQWVTLSNRHSSLQDEINGLQETVLNLMKNLGTDDPESLRTLLTAQLGSRESEMTALQRQLRLNEFDLEAMGDDGFESSEENGAGADKRNGSLDYATDVEWRHLNIELQTQRHEREVAQQQFGDGHPRIGQLTSDIEHAERMLRDREAQLGSQSRSAPRLANPMSGGSIIRIDVSTLKLLSARYRAELQLRSEEIGELSARVTELGEHSKKIKVYEEEILQKRAAYERVGARIGELEMEGKAPARISIASYAVEPASPDKDRRMRLTVVAGGGSFLLGLAIAFTIVRTDPRIHKAQDIRGPLRVPFLGQLPTCPPQTELLSDTNLLLTESIRMFRTSLLERLNATDKRVVLITSSTAVSGKTSVAVLLAKSMAALGKKVLLVEADLRRPSMSDKLGFKPRVGLAAALAGKANDEESISSTGISGFDVIMAGEQPAEFHAELLGNGIFASCLLRWKKQYDYVLLDSPPVLPVADAQILAGQADGVVMVLRASHSRRADVVQAYADLSAAGGTLLGTVLVDVKPRPGGGYYGGYDSPYTRQAQLKADS